MDLSVEDFSQVRHEEGELIALYTGEYEDHNLKVLGRVKRSFTMAEAGRQFVANASVVDLYAGDFHEYAFAEWLVQEGFVEPVPYRYVHADWARPDPNALPRAQAPADPDALPYEEYYDVQDRLTAGSR